jgi:hypothetical protein
LSDTILRGKLGAAAVDVGNTSVVRAISGKTWRMRKVLPQR